MQSRNRPSGIGRTMRRATHSALSFLAAIALLAVAPRCLATVLYDNLGNSGNGTDGIRGPLARGISFSTDSASYNGLTAILPLHADRPDRQAPSTLLIFLCRALAPGSVLCFRKRPSMNRIHSTALASMLVAVLRSLMPSSAAGATQTTINLQTTDLTYSSVNNTIYVSIPDGVATNPDSLTPINPATGALGAPIAIGFNPQTLVSSTDGTIIYTVFGGNRGIQPFSVPTQTLGAAFAITGGPQVHRFAQFQDRPIRSSLPRMIRVSVRRPRAQAFGRMECVCPTPWAAAWVLAGPTSLQSIGSMEPKRTAMKTVVRVFQIRRWPSAAPESRASMGQT